ncbi:MAG: hypothetical protein KME17_17330 [Cyanosarcina radialis HA8281-LM2]|jgi:hypothetical protein|nr:hypothetical protein [Cyanosarcina radialis HA8281-LM2]
MNATLLHLSIITGVATWSLLFWINWDWIKQGGRKRIFTVLASVHTFRYIGLVALIPSFFNPEPFNFSHTYLQQVAYGDFIAVILAIVAVIAVRKEWKTAAFWTWAFFLEGTADTLNAGPNFALHITDQNLVGAMGWLILTVYVPALVVTETLLGIHLVRGAIVDRKTRTTSVSQ